LRFQPVGFVLWKTLTKAVYLISQLSSVLPSLQIREITDSPRLINFCWLHAIFHFHFSFFYRLAYSFL
jgi:hypothetical protein